MNPVETFFAVWEREAEKTVEMLKMLPAGQYDFRPDGSGRSLGELAWHIAELDAYVAGHIAKNRDESGADFRPLIKTRRRRPG